MKLKKYGQSQKKFKFIKKLKSENTKSSRKFQFSKAYENIQ